MTHALLLAAILIEVAASLALKASGGFARLGLGVVALLGFGASLWLLARVSALLPISVTYPTWAGLGVVGATLGGALLFAERVGPQQILALILIVGGVVLLHAPAVIGPWTGAR